MKKNKLNVSQKRKGVNKRNMPNIGGSEILIIALIILFFFGPKKLPEFIRGIGEAIKEFKKSIKGK